MSRSMYSLSEYLDIHFVYGFCNGNATAAAREYSRRYPNRRVPDRRTISQVRRMIEHRIESRGRTANLDDGAVMNIVENEPGISIRELSRRTGISSTQVRLLKLM